MQKIDFNIKNELHPFVNCIMTGKSVGYSHTNIPLYADGYPGIMFQQSENGLYLLPRNKKLSDLFLYGQTLSPVSLDVEGPYKFIVMQLYPFAAKYLLGIDPKALNDDCYDLLSLEHVNIESYRTQLIKAKNLGDQVNIITALMQQLIQSNTVPQNDKIQQAIELIIKHKGQIKMQQLWEQLFITERTFERKFMSQVGLTAKQFAKIIQFQCSLQTLSEAKFNKLVEVGFDSGFTDQSHFIRTFKKYTGQTPAYFLKKIQLAT